MNNDIKLTDLDLMAMFRVAKEMANLDNDISEEEGAVFARYAQPLNMSESRMDWFIDLAVNMDWQNAINTLREMGPELKQYASNFLAEVAMADGNVSDKEDKTYNVFLEICGLPYTNIGQDEVYSATPKYSIRELYAIDEALGNVWDYGDAGLALKDAFWKRYDVYGENDFDFTMSEEEVVDTLYEMNDEKKQEVSEKMVEIIVTKDPESEKLCEAENIEQYYDYVLRTGLPDLLSSHVIDYQNDADDGELPEGLRFTFKDLYSIWNIIDTNCLEGSYVWSNFFSWFYVDCDIFMVCRDYNNLEQTYYEECAMQISQLGENEKICISELMAELVYANNDSDDDIYDILDVYKELVDNYGLPDCLDLFFEGHDLSEYRTDKRARIKKVEIEPDIFVESISQTKITVSVDVDHCKAVPLQCIASVYYADDDSPVPSPDYLPYGKYCWFDGKAEAERGTLGVWTALYTSLDGTSSWTNLGMTLANDFLPKDRDYYLKVRVFDLEEEAYISCPFLERKYPFKATKNEWNPDEAWLMPTYMVVRYNKRKHYFFDVIPNTSYTPCTVEFVTLPSGNTLMDVVKAKKLNYQAEGNTPDLNAISRNLDLSHPIDDDLRLAILYDPDGTNAPNPLQSLAGNIARETMVICLLTPDGSYCGFRKRRQLRDVLVAFEKHIDGDSRIKGSLASDAWFSGEAKRLVTRRFWDEINTSFYQLDYEIKISHAAKEIGDKDAKIDKVSFDRNVMIDGVSHTRFTLNFVINGCKGVKCTCECTLRDGGKYRTAIKCDEINYCGWYENICLHREFTPGYDSTRYSEFNLDIPNRILNKCKDLVGVIRIEFFTLDGYSPIEVVGHKDFKLKL